MKKLFIIIIVSLFMISCTSNGWTETEKKQFLNNCISMSNGAENAESICNCGLQKTIEKYKSKAEADKELQKMTSEETQVFYSDCL